MVIFAQTGLSDPERITLIGALVVALGTVIRAFVKGWVHSDKEFEALEASWQERFDEMRTDRDWWRKAATTVVKVAEQGTGLANKLAEGSPEVRQ